MAASFAVLAPLLLASFACGARPPAADEPGGSRPNIVLIMADDLGAEMLACYGNSAYSTPRLDQMAREGAHLENAFSAPICTPTRAMILTGLHPARTGFLERLDSPLDPEKTNRLPTHLTTFAQLFQWDGYATAIAGKWHLGDFQRYPDQPASHGFDEHSLWVQYWDGERRSRYYAPHNWENGAYEVLDETVFGPDHYSEFLLDFIERHRDRPFLVYYPMNLVHGPLVSPPSLESLAGERYPPDLGAGERLAGHMVTYMDAIVGRFLDRIQALGLEDRTLVVFTADNGSSVSLESRLGPFRLRGGKGTMNEAGTRVPFLARWPGVVSPGRRSAFFSLVDVLPTLAAVAGVPLRDPVDGMDLSHLLLGGDGVDRQYFPMAFEGGVFFVRGRRYRLHEDGRLYDVPVDSPEGRYSMEALVGEGEEPRARRRLQEQLDRYMGIRKTDPSYEVIPFGTGGDRFRNAQRASRPDASRGSL